VDFLCYEIEISLNEFPNKASAFAEDPNILLKAFC